MMPQVTVDSTEFNRKLIRLAAAVKVEAVDLVRGEARMVARDLIRLTPPFGTSTKAHRQGLRAVTHDFVKAVRPMKKENWRDSGIRRAIESKDVGALNAIFDKIPKMRGKRVERFSKSLHRQAQDRRYRIYRSKIGKTLTPDMQEWRERLKELQSRVGWMKSRWAVAFLALGGRSVPPWIKKHTISSKDALVDPSRLVGDMPTITIGNLTPGVGKQMGYNVDRAMRRAANRIYDKFIKVMLNHKYDIKNGVVRIHRPKQEGHSV